MILLIGLEGLVSEGGTFPGCCEAVPFGKVWDLGEGLRPWATQRFLLCLFDRERWVLEGSLRDDAPALMSERLFLFRVPICLELQNFFQQGGF